MKKTSSCALRDVSTIIAAFEISTRIQHEIITIAGGTLLAV